MERLWWENLYGENFQLSPTPSKKLSGKRSKLAKRIEIRISGLGGQGIVLAGEILGRAAVYEGKHAVQTQSYGPEARGGSAGSQVVIASDPIHHPHLVEPTNMIIISQGAYAKYVPSLAPGGTLLIDDGLVILPDDHRQDITTHGLPATHIAEELGNSRAANTSTKVRAAIPAIASARKRTSNLGMC